MSTWADPHQLALLEDPIDARFREFHRENPHVYVRLVAMAREWRAAGHEKCSMDMLFHLLRWKHGIETRSSDGLLLNDHYVSRFSRIIMANEPDLDGMFATRATRADRHG